MPFNSRFKRTTLFLAAIALVCFAGAGMAQASTTVETVGSPTQTLPVAKWISAVTFPTPDVKVRVEYGKCPGNDGDPLACAGSLNDGAYTITFNPDRLFEFDSEFMRSVTLHELGHVVDAAYFGEQTKRDFAIRLGYPEGREWSGDLEPSSGAKPSYIEPQEWFAEAYASCAWGGNRTDLTTYGFDLTYRQVLPLCQQISFQMIGKSIDNPPAPVADALCSPYCQTRLNVNDRFESDKQLVPGTVSAVVKLGKKAAMLDGGCKGKVKIAGDFVVLNFCSGKLRATSYSYKKFRILWWGQWGSVSEPPALPTVDDPHSKFTIDGGGTGPFPVDQWISDAKIPTPNISGAVVYGRCVNGQTACASSYKENYIWLDTRSLGEPGKDADYFRALFYRSLGERITRAYLGPEQQDTFKALLGFPAAANWGANDSSIPVTTSTPSRLFAEAYATCAWGADRPAATISYGFDRSYSSLTPICNRISKLIDGPPLVVRPVVQPPAPVCVSFCSVRLAPKVAWSILLPSPAQLAVVKVGKRFAVLPSGCSGTVRMGQAAVRLNYCGPTLRAKSIGQGQPALRYFATGA